MLSNIKKIIKGDKFLVSPSEKPEEYKNSFYKIPVYQRHYDWDEENAKNLVDDLREAVDIKKPHYTGAFLLTDSNPIEVIDGQQRMTTVFLMLKAFQLQCTNVEINNQINAVFFTDSRHLFEDYIRLRVSKHDNECFTNIICAKNFENIIPNEFKLYKNFVLLYEAFREMREKYSDDEIFHNGFESLEICELVIQNDIDDECQKIFRDLNAKGQSLKNSDLIRNFLLMSREDLFPVYWTPIENIFKINNVFQSELFETFIVDYVFMKLESKTNENKIFNAYVSYCELTDGEFSKDGVFDRELALADLLRYANIYKLFLNINCEQEAEPYKVTIALLKELRDMKQTTSYPFLMRVLSDERNGTIDRETLNKVINLIVVYHVRGSVCDISSGSFRGYLLTMYKNVFGTVPENKNQYYAALYKYIHEEGRSSRMPSEDKFIERLKTAPLYRNLPVCRHVLKTIVNGRYLNESKEKCTIDIPTVEHLIPQNPSKAWEAEVGGKRKLEEFKDYVDTLGNLSLSDRDKNSELGNKSRKEKIETLKKHNNVLGVLNEDFMDLRKKFDLNAVNLRCKKLSEYLRNNFSLEHLKTKGIYFDNYDSFSGELEFRPEKFSSRQPAYIEIEDWAAPANSFTDVEKYMLEYMYNFKKEKFLAIDIENKDLVYGNKPILVKEPIKDYIEILNTGYYFKREAGGHAFLAACRVANAIGIHMSSIRLCLRKEKVGKNEINYHIVDDLPQYSEEDVLYLSPDKSNKDLVARAIKYHDEIILLKGSDVCREFKPYLNACFVAIINNLREYGIIVDNKTTKDLLCKKSSLAAVIVTGKNENGKERWKDKNGVSFKNK